MPWAAAAAVVGGALIKNADNRSATSQASDAAAQNREANIAANRVDQTNPFGTSTWGTGPDGKPTQTTTLNSAQQGLLDTRNTTAANLGGAGAALSADIAPNLSHGIDTSGFTGWQNVIGQGSTNLMTHDWLGNVSSQGQAVADAGSQGSNYASGTPGGSVDPLAGYFGHPGGTPSAQPQYSGGGYGGGYTNAQASPPPAPAIPAGTGAAAGGNAFQVRDKFDTSGVTAKLPGSIDDTSRQRVEEALMSRLNPTLDSDTAALRSRLLNSGIEVGTDAYNREMTLDNQKRNDARMQTVLAGGQEEDRQTKLLQGLNDQQFQQALATGKFGQDADAHMAGNSTSMANAATAAAASGSAANAANQGAMDRLKMQLAQQSNEFNVNTGFKAAAFNNSLRESQLNEARTLRQDPLKELQAMGALSSPTMPTFQNYYTDSATAPKVVAPDTLGGAKEGLSLWNSF